ncbi:MAG: GNAT family N-acetyltransferase [Thermoplasmata archaeon]|nr:GNAT family N-acetyltransferase [Thermoplasmata archaeon]
MNISIVPFGSGDIPFGKSLTDAEEWHRTGADWARLLRIEPQGVFKATVDGKGAGVAAITSYGKLAWVHSVIVDRKYRGQGVGKALVNACIDYSDGLGVRTLKLDAVPPAKKFYEKLEFKTEFESLRFTRSGAKGSALVQRMRPEDLPRVEAFDQTMTKIDRTRVIREIFRDNPEWAFMARDSHGIRGYLLGRPDDARVNLGPCICVPGTEQWFVKMVRSAMSTVPEKSYRICVAATNHKALIALKSMSFQVSQSSTRMYMGEKFSETEANFAMISPEKG